MTSIDIRLKPHEIALLKQLPGKKLEYIVHERFLNTNLVYFVVKVKVEPIDPFYFYSCTEKLDYYGSTEDVAVMSIVSEPPFEYDQLDLIETPINETIHSIDLVQENQQEFCGDEQEYDNYVTRGIIFNFDDSQLSIEKSIWFSESFVIGRGTNLIEAYAPVSDFGTDWAPGHSGKCIRTIETLK